MDGVAAEVTDSLRILDESEAIEDAKLIGHYRDAVDAIPRHEATEKAWAWLETELSNVPPLAPERRERIEAALHDIDRTFIEWDQEAGLV